MGTSMLTAYQKQKKSIGHFPLEIVEKNKHKLKILKKKFAKNKFFNTLPNEWQGNVIVIAVKPQSFKKVALDIITKKVKSECVVSIMAGVSVETLKKQIVFSCDIIRAMPNKGSEVLLGATCIYSKGKITNYKKNIVNKLFKPLGKTYWIKDEALMDPVTAIAGSGPAYFFLFILNLIEIAKELGFTNNLAKELVFNTALGSIHIALKNKNLTKLINDVKSPGGTTEAALEILEKKKSSNLYNILKKAVSSANTKAIQISKSIN